MARITNNKKGSGVRLISDIASFFAEEILVFDKFLFQTKGYGIDTQ